MPEAQAAPSSHKFNLKEDWEKIPVWLKVGALAGIVVFYLLHRRVSAQQAAVTAPTGASMFQSGTPVNLTPGYSSAVGVQAQPASNSTTPVTVGSTPATNGIPWQSLGPANPGPPQWSNGTGILPVHPAAQLTPAQVAQVQNQLGPYGGSVISTTQPYATTPGWENVTQTTYSGGGSVTNLGTAGTRPQPGEVIPPAVQNTVVYNADGTPDWTATLAQSYVYPQNFHPGMVA